MFVAVFSDVFIIRMVLVSKVLLYGPLFASLQVVEKILSLDEFFSGAHADSVAIEVLFPY